MKIHCPCGGVIADSTDHLPNKAYLIPDQKWFSFWDAIKAAIEQPCSSPEEAETRYVKLTDSEVDRSMWQCERCGRLFIQNRNYELVEFHPEDTKAAKGLLSAQRP